MEKADFADLTEKQVMKTAPRIFPKFLNCAAQVSRLKIRWFLMRFGVKSDWIESNHAKSFVAGYYPSSFTDSPQKVRIVRQREVEKPGQDTISQTIPIQTL